MAGNQRIARMLVDHGADLKAVNDYGQTPLHVAIVESDLRGEIYLEDTVRMLVDRGADIHSRDSDGRTPLHDAAKGGNNTALEILIERGAEIDARCFKGRTPLIEAVYRYHIPRYRSMAGVSSPPRLTINDDLDNDHHFILALGHLLHHGADPNARDFDGVTALTVARRKRMGGVDRLLLLWGASE
jgi:ankyrin repeat protein